MRLTVTSQCALRSLEAVDFATVAVLMGLVGIVGSAVAQRVGIVLGLVGVVDTAVVVDLEAEEPESVRTVQAEAVVDAVQA